MEIPPAERFDQWYTDMANSPARDVIAQRTLGLPPEIESSGLLSWEGIGDVTEALALQPGDALVDLACGRGGYGLEIARRTEAKLIGIDFSRVAIERAQERATGDAQFRVGDLTATGLPDAFADAVLCVDAMQFAEPYEAAIAECRRILRSGGRLVLTGWEVADLGDDTVPPRLCRDIGAALQAGGFADVAVTHMPAWLAAERAYWVAAVDLDPAGDAALETVRGEGLRVRHWLDRARRVLATGRAPAPS